VVHLTGVTCLASSGPAVLIRAAHRASERDLRLRLVAASRTVRRPLQITGCDQLFDIYEDVPAAVGPDD
jgi:anti-sigma B factor antagonist